MSNLVTLIFLCCIFASQARIHKLPIEEDFRSAFPISSFGFQVGGTLAINLQNFYLVPIDDKGTV